MTQAYFSEQAVNVRHDLTLELFPSEILELRPTPDRVELVSINGEPAGATDTAEPTDLRVSLQTVGRHHFRLHDRDGSHDLHLMCVDPAVRGFVEQHCRSAGHGGATIDEHKVRTVIRSLCAAPFFDGTLECLMTGEPARSLNHFGA